MENELCRASHKFFRIKYHFVFCIKYRKDLFLKEKYTKTIKKTCEEIQQRYHVKFETIGFDGDHIKIITAIMMFEDNKEIKEELHGGGFWSDGSYAETVGEGINADII